MLVILSFVYLAPPLSLCFPLVNIFILFLFYNLCIVYSSPIVSGLGLKNIKTNLIRTPVLCTWSLLYLHPQRNLNQLNVAFHTPGTLKIVTNINIFSVQFYFNTSVVIVLACVFFYVVSLKLS